MPMLTEWLFDWTSTLTFPSCRFHVESGGSCRRQKSAGSWSSRHRCRCCGRWHCGRSSSRPLDVLCTRRHSQLALQSQCSGFPVISEHFHSSFRALSQHFQSSFLPLSEQFLTIFRAVLEQFQSSFLLLSEQFQSKF